MDRVIKRKLIAPLLIYSKILSFMVILLL